MSFKRRKGFCSLHIYPLLYHSAIHYKMRFLDRLSLVKFVGFMATLVKTVGSNSSSNEGSQTTNTNEKELTKPLDSWSLIIVSTLDGKLSALDARQDGALRWSLPSLFGPLLSFSLGSLQNGKQVRVIPSLDGGLYQVYGEKIEPIPYTADNLLGSFYKLQDGSMLVGGKEAISCGIDPKTGKVKYVCSDEGCKLTDHDSEEHVKDIDIFVVKWTKQTVRAVDQRTGSESWNFSVGQQDVTFLDADTKCPMEDREETVEWKLRVSIPEGLIAAVKLHDLASVASDIVLWSHKFESPINAVWMLHGSYLKSVDLFSDDVLPGLRDGLPNEGSRDRPIMYLGSHEGHVYIQHSQHSLNPSLDSAIRMQSKGNHDVGRKPRAITWQPKLAASASRTPTAVSKEIAIWNPVEYSFVVPPHKGKIENLDEVNKTLNKTNQDSGQANQSSSKLEYWKGAIFVVVVLAAIAQYLFRFLLPKRQQKREQLITSSTFVSRYAADFEQELCLGEGGFGKVFKARRKMDDCQYAIKRVCLPNCDEAIENVIREVKALAKLDHPKIVRYFDAWFEAPPVGCQEEKEVTYLGDRTCTDSNLDSEESSKHPRQSNATDEDQRLSFDVHQPETDDSGSFGVEFVDSRKNSKSSSCESLSPSFKTSGSLLSVKNHKCNSKKCTKDTIQAPLYLFIQMQLCKRENLKDWLKNNKERDHSYCLSVFDQIASAVEYFHGRGMMHRDLKPSNIFFSMDGSVKVGDFGWAKSSVEEATDNLTKGKNGFIDANHTGQAGTLLYMSPEQIEGKAYSYKVDVFSLGLIFFELFHTFSTEMERIKVMNDVKQKTMPDEFRSKMVSEAHLVDWMLSENPKNRPSAPELRTSEEYRFIMQKGGNAQRGIQWSVHRCTEQPVSPLFCLLKSIYRFIISIITYIRNMYRPTREKDGKSLADALAWNFYFDYLKHVLPNLKMQINDTEKYRYKINVWKLFIVLPKNCEVFDKISNKDSDPRGLVEAVGNLSPLRKDRGGVQDRVYQHTVYRITEKKPDGNEKHHFCVMEYATPLMTLHDMSDDLNAGLSKKERDEQVVLFIRKLKEILNEDPHCMDNYQLITLSEESGQDLGKIMIDVLNNSETIW